MQTGRMHYTPLDTTMRRPKVRLPILVIENNADHWLVIRSTLAQCFPEVEPFWINNPTQVARYMEETAFNLDKLPSLILMEIHLPNLEAGWTLLASLKAHPRYQRIPVIILSHSQEPADVDRSYALGAASYVIKPRTTHQWITCLYTFRRYWWEVVSLPKRLLQFAPAFEQ